MASRLRRARHEARGAAADLQAERIAGARGHRLADGALTVGLTADQLGLHPRTLQRRLAAEGSSFVVLVDKVRRETAEQCLRDTDISLEHLTRLLGYAEQSVLTRACQRWFNASPTSYREGRR
ncbi:helix-turn-helix domain-containing protein [Mycolicibacterium moriokaense]|nr:helix-turn-helix domain-containing protein [Mycolicibacterium moriokaense]